MDDAAVHTIDAWCQRMLREHAFDSGCLFDEELLGERDRDADRSGPRLLAPAGLSAEGADSSIRSLAVWSTVGALTEDARKLLEKELPRICRRREPGRTDRPSASRSRHASLAALKSGWVERAREMQAWLDVQFAAKASPFVRGASCRSTIARDGSACLAAWAGDASAQELALGVGATKLAHTCMKEALLPGTAVKLPAHFAAFEQLMQSLARLRPVQALRSAMRLHAAASIARRLRHLKEQAGTFGFADMLARLDNALDEQFNGANAHRLRDRILAQYPVALIDEFQDTSPVQSRIFDRLYRVSATTIRRPRCS